MKPKKKTTKELETERAQARLNERQIKAGSVLLDLRAQIERLQHAAKMGDLINEIREHIEWLIAEDEAYANAAARIFLEECLHRNIPATDRAICVGAEDNRDHKY